MRATGRDTAPVEHQNMVGIQHAIDALGDDKSCAIGHRLLQRLLDVEFGVEVHCAGAVIKNQDGRFHQQGAGDGHALTLPAGEICPRASTTLS